MRSSSESIMSCLEKMSTDITQLLIAKPKKVDNTFVCNIKQPFLLSLNGSQVVHIKENSDNSQFIFLKNKSMYSYMYDLNVSIIDTVKQNCGTWFNTNMNPDLIDDYYTTTIVYDKTHGDLIKLKVTGNTLFPKEVINTKLNISLIANNIRFYKQKFVLETVIDKYETGCDIIDFSDAESDVELVSDEDEPYPSEAEIEEMRNDIISKCQVEIDKLQQQLNYYSTVKQNICDAKESDQVIQIYDKFVADE